MGGIALPILNAISVASTPNFLDFPDAGQWRPPQWGQPGVITSIIVPASAITGSSPYLQYTVYVFDAILRAEHNRELKITEHPVQTGAAINDHAYVMPSRVVLEIGMSDVMDSYYAGNWTGNPSKSVSAFETLTELQSLRVPITLSTRLKSYENMMVESIQSTDTHQTKYGLRAVVTFRELMLATVAAISSRLLTGADDAKVPDANSSARPQLTDQSAAGTTQTATPDKTTLDQHNIVKSSFWSLQRAPGVAGAGSWSSNNLAGLNKIVPGLISKY